MGPVSPTGCNCSSVVFLSAELIHFFFLFPRPDPSAFLRGSQLSLHDLHRPAAAPPEFPLHRAAGPPPTPEPPTQPQCRGGESQVSAAHQREMLLREEAVGRFRTGSYMQFVINLRQTATVDFLLLGLFFLLWHPIPS